MFVSAPEASARITLPESRMRSENALRTVRLEHNFSILHRIFLLNIDEKMHVISTKSELSYLKALRFKFSKSGCASINVRLLQKAFVPIFRCEHHHYPIVPRVARGATERFNFFKALAILVDFRFSGALPYSAGRSPACSPDSTIDFPKRKSL